MMAPGKMNVLIATLALLGIASAANPFQSTSKMSTEAKVARKAQRKMTTKDAGAGVGQLDGPTGTYIYSVAYPKGNDGCTGTPEGVVFDEPADSLMGPTGVCVEQGQGNGVKYSCNGTMIAETVYANASCLEIDNYGTYPVEDLTNFQTCDSQNLLVCSFAADLEGAAKEVGAVATVTAYAGSSYANSKVDPTYACTSDPLKKVTGLFAASSGHCQNLPPGMDDDEYAGFKSVDMSLCEDGTKAIKGYAYSEYNCGGDVTEKHKISGGCFDGQVYQCL